MRLAGFHAAGPFDLADSPFDSASVSLESAVPRAPDPMRVEGLVLRSNDAAVQKNSVRFVDFSVAHKHDLMHALCYIFPLTSQIDRTDSDRVPGQFHVSSEIGLCHGLYRGVNKQTFNFLASERGLQVSQVSH